MDISIHRNKNKNIQLLSQFWGCGLDINRDKEIIQHLNMDTVKIILREMTWEYEEYVRRNYD